MEGYIYDAFEGPEKYPNVLKKACFDPYYYMIKMNTGEVFFFTKAEPVNEQWVLIKELDLDNCQNLPTGYFGRGAEININEIAWIADNPHKRD